MLRERYHRFNPFVAEELCVLMHPKCVWPSVPFPHQRIPIELEKPWLDVNGRWRWFG